MSFYSRLAVLESAQSTLAKNHDKLLLRVDKLENIVNGVSEGSWPYYPYVKRIGMRSRLERLEGVLQLRCDCCEDAQWSETLRSGGIPRFKTISSKFRCETCTKNTKKQQE